VFAEDNLAEFVATFLKEGVLARIYGRLVVQERLTRNGDNRHVIELQARQIVVLREPQVESTDDAPGTASLKLLSPKEEECSPL
jgi:single-stranded DNA-binding protein